MNPFIWGYALCRVPALYTDKTTDIEEWNHFHTLKRNHSHPTTIVLSIRHSVSDMKPNHTHAFIGFVPLGHERDRTECWENALFG